MFHLCVEIGVLRPERTEEGAATKQLKGDLLPGSLQGKGQVLEVTWVKRSWGMCALRAY